MPETTEVKTSGSLSRQLRRLNAWFWRWHFLSAVAFAPLIVAASISGAIFVWEEEGEALLQRGLKFVEPAQERVSFDAMIAGAQARTSGEFASLEWPGVPGHSAIILLRDEADKLRVVWVNPHTGEATGWRYRDRLFFIQVRDFHRFLWSGLPGRLAVEMATSWTIVLTLSGIVLWWNGSRRKPGQWKLFQRHKPYLLWRNWHSVPAVWLSVFILIILVTGLTFSKGAGTLWKGAGAATGAFPESYLDHPHYDTSQERLSYEELVARAAAGHDEAPEVSIIDSGGGHVPLILRGDRHASPWTLSVSWVNPVSGAVVERAHWLDMSAFSQFMVASYALHVGWIGGIWTKLLATFLCLLLVFLVVSGVAMWWIRRPRGKAGFPRRRSEAIPRWLLGLNLVLAVIFPAVGATLLLYGAGSLAWCGLRRLTGAP